MGATHVLIDIPVGRTAKVRSWDAAECLAALFRAVADRLALRLEVVITEARGPIGRGLARASKPWTSSPSYGGMQRPPRSAGEGPLSGRTTPGAHGCSHPPGGYRAAQQVLDSGAAETAFTRIVTAQGRRDLPPEAPYRSIVEAPVDGRIREIDSLGDGPCRQARRCTSPCGGRGTPGADGGGGCAPGRTLFEIHAQSEAHLAFARAYAEAHPAIVRFGF